MAELDSGGRAAQSRPDGPAPHGAAKDHSGQGCRPRPVTFSLTDGWTIGSDVATMLTGLSAVTAAATWLISRYRAWQTEKNLTRARNWNGFIMTTGISDWYVRLVDDPKTPTAVVPIEIVNRNGDPDPQMAHGLRQTIIRDGMLARVQTEQEFAFLKFLHKELGYGKGQMIR